MTLRALPISAAVFCFSISGLFAGTPDPTLLPIATTSQVPNTSAYNALNVGAMAAGASYTDPVTGIRVYKLTSSSFPVTGYSFTHDYAEGGNEVSLPLNSSGTRAIHVYTGDGNQWVIDFTPGSGVSNPRSLTTSAFPPFMNLCVTFSSNPSTPYYMYVSTGSTIYRVDVRTMTAAPGGGWPVNGETQAMWLHQNENDSFFTWMRGANGPTIVGYEPATGTLKTYSNAGVNEPRIDRDATNRYVCLSMTTPENQALFWDWKNNTIAWSSPTQSFGGAPPVAHQASLRGYWVGVDWTQSYPWQFYKISATPNSIVNPLPGGAAQGGGHCDGNWNQHPANAGDQWYACYYYGALAPPSNVGAVAPGAVLLSTANGQRRALAHLYNTTATYTYYSFAKLSPDGAYVLFTSDMNGSARSDLFLAELPSSGSTTPPPVDTTPPSVSITAPAGGATVSANVAVTATATDNVGVAGVQFRLDSALLGSEVTAAPYSISWNTTTATNGSHSLTAVARDAAGNQATSAVVTVTVSNATADTTPPTVPANVSATAVSSSQINVSWSASTDTQSGVAGYKIFRNGTQTGTSATTAYSDTGLTPSTAYTYSVAAYDVAGNTSAQSAGATASTQAAPTTTVGAIAVLHFEEPAGSTAFADASGANNNGSCTGTGCPTAGVAGKVGRGVSFAGGQFVTIPGNTGLNTFPITVSAWFKTASTSGVVGLVNKYVGGSYNGYNVFLNNGSVCAWYLKDANDYVYDGSGCTFNIAGYNNNAWHQVTYVVDASGGRLYLDGVQKGSLGWTGVAGSPSTTQDVQIGHYPGAFGGAEYYQGLLDEVRIYNVALSSSDVTALYTADNATPADTTPPTVSITAPASGASVSGSVAVTASASDNVGVVGVQFMLDGGVLGNEVTAAPYTTSWNSTLTANGSHTLTAVARDAAGNRTTSAAVTVTVANTVPDTTPPTVPANVSATAMSSSQINVAWGASTDTQSGVAGYKIFRNGLQIATSATTSYSDAGLSASTAYTYTIAAYDVAGNTSAQSAAATATTQAAAVPAGGAIAVLHFEEPAGSTTFADASGTNNNGSCTGIGCPTAGVAGKVGLGLSFDGMSDLVTIRHNAGLNTFPITVSAWFKTASTSGVVGLVNKYVGGSYNGYNVFLNNGSVCAWYLKDANDYVYDGSGCTFNIAGYNNNAWHQVTYVVDASGGRLYLDGVQKGSLGWTGVAGSPSTTQDVQIGHYPGAFGGAEYYQGLLDEVRIYNTALSSSNVTALYTAANGTTADTTPPAVSITSPANGASVSGAVSVTANASDNVGVAGVQFLLDGGVLGSEVTTAPFAVTWTTTLASNGTHTLSAIARDAAGNRTTSASVTVTVFNGEAPFTGTAASLPGRVEAENFDRGGEGIAYHDLTPGNQGGYYRTSEDVDIINPYANAYVVDDFQTGEWMKYTVSVAQSGQYKLQALVSSISASSRFHIEIDGVNVTGDQKVPNTGSFGTFMWVGPSGVNLTAGQHVMKLVSDQEYFNVDAISATLEVATATPAKGRAVHH